MEKGREPVTYIRYEIENIQPLRIADDSTSQSGQTSTLKYIPGTTIRGYVMNRLCHDAEFDKQKTTLFSEHVRFLNCALIRDSKELLPPLKGFYEDKQPAKNGKKEIENVTVSGKFREGSKRASLGNACRIEGDTIFYYHVGTGSDMKIRIKLKDHNDKQNVFRSEYIRPGCRFAGYIAIDESAASVRELIRSALGKKGDSITLGNARTSGMGMCRIHDVKELAADEYCRIASLPEKSIGHEIYMILLSNTVMRDENGKYCGLNLSELEKKLGVKNLQILRCSTSVVDVRGYNSHLHLKNPSVTMYERGSVFHFTFEGSMEPAAMKNVAEKGIGVRRNEGFGQILFAEPEKYRGIHSKQEIGNEKGIIPDGPDVQNDEDTLKIIARNVLRRKIGNYFSRQIVSSSTGDFAGGASEAQKGSVRALLLANKYNFAEAKSTLEKYFGHAQEKQNRQNVHKERAEVSGLEKFVMNALNLEMRKAVPEASVLGFPVSTLIPEEEFGELKIDYILNVFEYDNRKKA